MTNQEAFDKIMSHLRSLNAQSADESGDCVYNGSRCAIGALMTDEEQEKFGAYEGPVEWLIKHMQEEGHSSYLFDLDKVFLESMQALHDSCASWGPRGFTGEPRAEIIAQGCNLVYTAPAPTKESKL